jgi:GxxExxY protein
MSELVEKELVYQIVGSAMAVLNEIGHGLREKTYERAMCVEFAFRHISYSQQKRYPVIYRGQKVDEFVPDLEVEDRVLVDTKTVDSIDDQHRGQVLNYLRISERSVGVILNFKHRQLQWERLVMSR